MVVRPDGTHVLPVQNKICQNHFFKIQFSFAEKLEKADVFLILWDSCGTDMINAAAIGLSGRSFTRKPMDAV